MSSIRLTDEQVHILDLARRGDNLIIHAFAGTGKTTTAEAVIREMQNRRPLYLVFNKAMSLEAKERIRDNAQIRTFHSLAYAGIRPNPERLQKRLSGSHVATHLNLPTMGIRIYNHAGAQMSYTILPARIGALCLRTISNWTTTSDRKLGISHVPSGPDIINDDLIGNHKQIRLDSSDVSRIQEIILANAGRLLDDMMDKNGVLPITHDFYFKQYLLSNPVIKSDMIIVDEAQDMNPAFIHLLRSQKAQMIWVGDSYQQIYEWRGAVNAMGVNNDATRSYLTNSFRFGDNVAKLANKILETFGEERRIKGVGAKPENGSSAIICRTNLNVIEKAIELESMGAHFQIESNTASNALALINELSTIKYGGRSKGAFSLFRNWNEIVDYSQSKEGGDLKPVVDIMENHNPDSLIRILQNGGSRVRNSATVLSTIHKAKGLEWDRVKVVWNAGNDENPAMTDEERRLAYVAVTRAKHHIDAEDLMSMINIHSMAARKQPVMKQALRTSLDYYNPPLHVGRPAADPRGLEIPASTRRESPLAPSVRMNALHPPASRHASIARPGEKEAESRKDSSTSPSMVATGSQSNAQRKRHSRTADPDELDADAEAVKDRWNRYMTLLGHKSHSRHAAEKGGNESHPRSEVSHEATFRQLAARDRAR